MNNYDYIAICIEGTFLQDSEEIMNLHNDRELQGRKGFSGWKDIDADERIVRVSGRASKPVSGKPYLAFSVVLHTSKGREIQFIGSKEKKAATGQFCFHAPPGASVYEVVFERIFDNGWCRGVKTEPRPPPALMAASTASVSRVSSALA